MKWIGLTGGIASGKTTVANLLRSRGYEVVDADQLAREVVRKGSDGLTQVVGEFGTEVLGPDGELDRKKLASMIFRRPDLRLKLENITHPLIRKLTETEKTRIQKAGAEIAFYDVPLLFEKKMEDLFDSILLVAADESVQRERMKRERLYSDEEISQRLASQIPLMEKISKSTYVIHNNGSRDRLERQLDSVLKKITRPKSSPKLK